MQKGSLVATLWLDNKVVTVLSTNTQPDSTGAVLRRQQSGSRISITCPTSIVLYNRFMGGLDRNDQLRKYYHVRLKGRKPYKYIFWFLHEVSITNAYILFIHYCIATNRDPAMKSLKEFRLELARGLIGDYNSRKRPGRGATVRPTLAIRHFPVKAKKSTKKGVGRCHYCSNIRQPPRRGETVWYCPDCQVYLCHTGLTDGSDCFLLHHKS